MIKMATGQLGLCAQQVQAGVVRLLGDGV